MNKDGEISFDELLSQISGKYACQTALLHINSMLRFNILSSIPVELSADLSCLVLGDSTKIDDLVKRLLPKDKDLPWNTFLKGSNSEQAISSLGKRN